MIIGTPGQVRIGSNKDADDCVSHLPIERPQRWRDIGRHMRGALVDRRLG